MSALCLLLMVASSAAPIRIGSKKFTESVVLGELFTQLAQSAGASAEHRKELGGTRVLWDALLRGDLDAYPEYTGTLTQELVPNAKDPAALERALDAQGLALGAPLGFDNTYAIGMLETRAQALGLKTLSDLAAHPELVFGFSNEFLERADGWPALRFRYQLKPRQVSGLEHALA